MSKNLFSHKAESPGGDIHNVQQGRLALRWGKVVELAPEFCQARVETDELDEIPTYWLSIIFPKTWEDKYYWMPELDEHVWFLWDEQAEEGIILGAFYCADVPLSELHEPTPHKTEIHWGDESFVYYTREEHRLEVDIKGEIIERATDGNFHMEASEDMTMFASNINPVACEQFYSRSTETVIEACERIILRAPEVIIEGSLIIAGGAGGMFSFMGGGGMFSNGVPLVGLGAAVATPVGAGAVISTGIAGFVGGAIAGPQCPECPEPEPAEEVEVELEGDLRRLQGYTPPGFE